MQSGYWQELTKALLDIAVTIVTLGLGWFVGQRLTAYWAIRQKRRELELAAVNEFYRLYGEFFATWKSWAYCVNPPDDNLMYPGGTRWQLLERASAA